MSDDATGDPIGELPDEGTTRWTDARRTALETVAAGRVTKTWSLKGHPAFVVAGYGQNPRQGPHIWMAENGFVRPGEPNLCGTSVVLSETGYQHLTATKDTP